MKYVRPFSVLFCILTFLCSANIIFCMGDNKAAERRKLLRDQARGYPQSTPKTPICDEWTMICCLYACFIKACCSKEVVAQVQGDCGCVCCSNQETHAKKQCKK